jgi:asparagine synthase (glutamine-hydrolysing)
MCGIVGVVHVGDAATVRRMAAAIKHRGPDDEGYYADPQGAAHLGMVRLSIIDLATGRQPMTDEQQRYHLVFNGEIYNHRELRAGLEQRGHRFRSQADTEVIVHLYEEEGERCVERLQGDFAIALWDAPRQRLFLARDRVGVKPLYYWAQGDRLAFASELKALLRLPQVSRTLDAEALDAYFTFLYIPAPRSIFQEVRKLPPAHWLLWQAGKVQLHRYWQPPPPDTTAIAPARAAQDVLEGLTAAVRRQLMSDVPLGAFLSGGIDSGAVVGLMSRLTNRPVRTFSLGFAPPDDTYNELPAARLTAQAFGTEHQEFVVKPDVATLLPQVVRHLDEPYADSSALLNFLISREARRHVTVALAGVGGDELFAGYPRYQGAQGSLAFEQLPRVWRQALAAWSTSWPESTTSTNWPGRAKRFLQGAALPRSQRYLTWITFAAADMKQALYAPRLHEALGRTDACAAHRRILEEAPGGYVDQVLRLDLLTYLPDDLLVMADKMSMAHGLELRVPFCDQSLVELAARLPAATRLPGGQLKGLLKRAVQGLLPPALLSRRKQGFMLPLAAWLRDGLRPLCEELLSPEVVKARGWLQPQAVQALRQAHVAGRANWAHQLYAAMVFEVWCREYLDGPGAA